MAPVPSMVPPARLTVPSVVTLLKINVPVTVVVPLKLTVPLNVVLDPNDTVPAKVQLPFSIAVPLNARVPVPLNWELLYVPPVSDSVAPAAIWNVPVLFVPDVPIENVVVSAQTFARLFLSVTVPSILPLLPVPADFFSK